MNITPSVTSIPIKMSVLYLNSDYNVFIANTTVHDLFN